MSSNPLFVMTELIEKSESKFLRVKGEPPPEGRMMGQKKYVIIGGGIAGITAVEQLMDMMPEGSIHITVLTATKVIKQVRIFCLVILG